MDDLLRQFEKDILFDAHGFDAKVRRSKAGKQLVAFGQQALPLIVKHLEETKPFAEGEVSCAWAALMSDIGVKHNLGSPRDLVFGNISSWITWAKSVTS